MENTLAFFDKVNEMYFELEKNRIQGYHQFLKTDNEMILRETTNEYINDGINLLKLLNVNTDILTESKLKLNTMFRKNNIDEEAFSDILESVTNHIDIKLMEYNNTFKYNNIGDIAIESYTSAILLHYNEQLNFMCEESMFILSSLENMHILTEADEANEKSTGVKNEDIQKDKDVESKSSDSNNNTKESIVSKGKKLGNVVWQKLKEFFTKIKNMFKDKVTKIIRRDEKWLKENRSKISNINVDGLVVDLNTGIDRNFSTTSSELLSLSGKLGNIKLDENAYENSKSITDKYRDKNGDLKQGVINYTRTGNSKTEPKIVSVKGNDIRTVALKMHTYCEDYISKHKDMDRVLQQSENHVKKFEQESRRRGITESFSLVENDLYINTDLALCENYNVLLEAENIGVRDQNDPKEKASRLDDKALSSVTKLLRDEQIIVSATITAMEARYFEYIKILRALIK